MRRPRIIHLLVLPFLFVNVAAARDIHVNNVAGNDQNSGELDNSATVGVGPTQTIGRALRLAAFGDRVIIANTGEPYRECISVQGVGNSGSIRYPFVIEGNGATLDGTGQIPHDCWRSVGKYIFAFEPKKKSFQQLFLDDQPTQGYSIEREQLDLLKPKQWARANGQIYFRADKGKLPDQYNLSHSVHSIGITLYQVSNVEIRDLVVRGYQLDGVNAADNALDCVLEGITANGNGRSGISVGGASRVKISECEISDNRTTQIRTEGWSTTDIVKTEISNRLGPKWSVEGGRLFVDNKEYSRAGASLGRNPLHRSAN